MDYVRTSPTKRRKSFTATRQQDTPTKSRSQQGSSDNGITPKNQTMLQAFEWYLPGRSSATLHGKEESDDQEISHWQRLARLLPELKHFGIMSIWIPPACKATCPDDNGYGVHDLWDLGEFDTKGGSATKWGHKDELVRLGQEAENLGISLVFDAVLNHRAAADGTEEVEVVRCDEQDRNQVLDDQPFVIEAWTEFPYESRKGEYSSMKYDKSCFNGTDWDQRTGKKQIYKFCGTREDGSEQDWAHDVDRLENGNNDMLMFANLDYGNAAVREDVKRWGDWLVDHVPGIGGMRLDAIKHYSAGFVKEFVAHVNATVAQQGKEMFWIGEYWNADSEYLLDYNEKYIGSTINMFDVALLYNLHNASAGRLKDLRQIFRGSMVSMAPDKAVTFIANHDTQETQTSEAPVEPWFVPHAYALILLRDAGHPCVFWGDLYGTQGPKAREPACGGKLLRLVKARDQYAYGRQTDHFDDSTCIGWTREGVSSGSDGTGLAVLVCTSWSWKRKRMSVGKKFAGQVWTDLMGFCWSGVLIDNQGFGEFVVGPRSISVWAWKDAFGRDEIDNLVHPVELDLDDEDDRNGHA